MKLKLLKHLKQRSIEINMIKNLCFYKYIIKSSMTWLKKESLSYYHI